MSITVRKVLAYITHRDRLLVFSHPYHPDAGIQVPAGTMKDGERPEAAVMREAFEETGLSDLALAGYLGEEHRDMSDFGIDQIHHRHFFHLRCAGQPPDRWRHFETDPLDSSAAPIEFELFWVPLPDGVPVLIGSQGQMLPELLKRLATAHGFSQA